MGKEKCNQENKYERIGREETYHGRLLHVYADTLILPDGNEAVFDVIDHKGAAAIVPVLPDGRILLVRQFRHAISSFTWEIPAGGRDSADEPFLTTAVRELKEETGRTAGHFEKLISINPVAAYSSELIDIFLATDLSEAGEQDLDEDEFIDVKAFTLDEILEKIFSFEIRDSKTIAAVLAVKERHPELF